jgi:hypothetical protein
MLPLKNKGVFGSWLASKGINALKWPPQSPDMNPIDLVWNFIKQKLYEDYPAATSRDNLIEYVTEIWQNLTVKYGRSCIDRSPKVFDEIVTNKGDISN